MEAWAVGDYVSEPYMVRIHAEWGRTNDLKSLYFEYIERCMPTVWRQIPKSNRVEMKFGILLQAV